MSIDESRSRNRLSEPLVCRAAVAGGTQSRSGTRTEAVDPSANRYQFRRGRLGIYRRGYRRRSGPSARRCAPRLAHLGRRLHPDFRVVRKIRPGRCFAKLAGGTLDWLVERGARLRRSAGVVGYHRAFRGQPRRRTAVSGQGIRRVPSGKRRRDALGRAAPARHLTLCLTAALRGVMLAANT